jgi:oligopeptide/dipeptide ABC transporter ATP-binding protein
MTNLLEARDLKKHFPIHSALLRRTTGHVKAVDGVDVDVIQGQTLGLVGESGSGKSTLGRLLIQLIDPTGGTVELDGRELSGMSERRRRPLRREMQMVFQDPYSSFDPLATIGESLSEPLVTHTKMSAKEREKKVGELLEVVRLRADHRHRYPREFSGGQLQRIAIARALALNPKLIVLDEPVSSLDVSIQADVINLLQDLQSEFGLTYVFIAHDLAVVRHVSDRIAVMYLGRIVEEGESDEVYFRPKHPYTKALLSAIPIAHPHERGARERIVLAGDPPSPANPPSGCRFHTRCPLAMQICSLEDPAPFAAPDGSQVACHLHTSGPTLLGAPLVELTQPV